MTTPPTPSDILEKVRELVEMEKKATEVPWTQDISQENESNATISLEFPKNGCIGVVLKGKHNDGTEGFDNLPFICEMRNSFPQIAESFTKLYKENILLKEKLSKHE